MILRRKNVLILVFLIGIYLDDICGESKKIGGHHKKRGVIRKTRKTAFQNLNQPKSGRAFQVLNQPKGAATISNPIPELTPPPSANTTTTTPEPLTTTARNVTKKLSPLLDFPDYEDTPLLDFPDPYDAELRRKYAGYDKTCQTQWKDKQKMKARRRRRDKNQEVVHETETQNRRLRQALINNAITNDPVPEHNPVFGFKLLDQTAEVFQAMCPNQYVPDYFINNAIYAFKKLHYITSSDRVEFLSPQEFKWISSILSTCVNGSKPIVFFPEESCKETILAWKQKKNWLCTKWEDDFNKRVYDPLLDLIWHMYNTVHAYCFHLFEEGFQLLHTYGAAMTDLYSSAIRQRWQFQIEGNNTEYEFWDMILGPNHEHYFRNIERCTQAAAELNLHGVLIPRYVIAGSIRYDKNAPNDPFNGIASLG